MLSSVIVLGFLDDVLYPIITGLIKFIFIFTLRKSSFHTQDMYGVMISYGLISGRHSFNSINKRLCALVAV